MPLTNRQRCLQYIYDPVYVNMAKRRGWGQGEVLRRAARRMRALHYLKISRPGRPEECLGLENPFIEDHGWKFMVRESLIHKEQRLKCLKQNRRHLPPTS
jgi:hypothetical protein